MTAFMLSPLFELTVSPLDLIVRTLLVYAIVLVLLRIAGRRQIAQMGPTELVAMLLISNAVQNSMVAGDSSLAGGLISAATLVVCSRAIRYLTFHSHTMSALIEGKPITVVIDGKILGAELRKVLMTAPQLRALLMLQGVEDMAEVRRVVLDSEGRLIVTHKGSPIESEIDKQEST